MAEKSVNGSPKVQRGKDAVGGTNEALQFGKDELLSI